MNNIKKVITPDANLRQVQENIFQVFNGVIDKQVIDGVLIKDVALTTGSVTLVDHKLGRKPLGYIIVKRNANSVIWDTNTTARNISLNCSANVTVNLWIF